MDQIYLLEILVIKLCIRTNKDPRLSVQCEFGNVGKIIIENEYELIKDDAEIGIVLKNFKSGKSLLFPMKPADLLIELVISPLVLKVLREGEVIAEAFFNWEQSFMDGVALNYKKNDVAMPLNTVEVTLKLYGPVDGRVVGSIDIYIRLSSLGQNVLSNFLVAKRNAQSKGGIKSEEDLRKNKRKHKRKKHVTLSEPSKEDEDYESSDLRLYRDDKKERPQQMTKKTSTINKAKVRSKSKTKRAKGVDDHFKIKAGIVSGRNDAGSPPEKGGVVDDASEKLTNYLSEKLEEYINMEDFKKRKPTSQNVVVGYQVDGNKDESVGCNLKTCPLELENKPLNIACSLLFGEGQAKSKFCQKSKPKKALVSNKVEKCTRATCRAYHPCLPPGCGPCEVYGDTIPGICCQTPGKLCAICGGYSVTGRTCLDIPGARFIDRKPPKGLFKKYATKDINPFKCRNECKGQGRICTRNTTGEKCKIEESEVAKMRAGKPRPHPKPNDSKYVYTAGDRFPIGPTARHKYCIDDDNHVPKNMGWLWTYRPNVGRPYDKEYKPGYVPAEVKTALEALPKPEPKSPPPVSKEFKATPYVRPRDPSPSQKSNDKGVYYVTVQSFEDPRFQKDSDNPFLDYTPLELELSKALTEKDHYEWNEFEEESKELQTFKEICKSVCAETFEDIFREDTSEIDELIGKIPLSDDEEEEEKEENLSSPEEIELVDVESNFEQKITPLVGIPTSAVFYNLPKSNLVHMETQYENEDFAGSNSHIPTRKCKRKRRRLYKR